MRSKPPPHSRCHRVGPSSGFKLWLGPAALFAVVISGCGQTDLVQPEADQPHGVQQSSAAAVPGGKIGFTLGIWGVSSEIGVINPDGSGLANLTNTPEAEMMGGWSPDGSRILFTRVSSPSEWHIWVMDSDGTNQIQLTSGPGVRVAATFSPDGSRISYSEASDASFSDLEIIVANADGSSPVNVSQNPAGDGCSRWSPDGTQFLFESNRDGIPGTNLYLMNVDGSNVRQLTSPKGIELCGSWSPDGSQIAHGAVGNRRPGIYTVNPDATESTRIHAHGFAAQPWYAPDGSWLVFHQWHGGVLQLHLIRLDGSGFHRLTNLPEGALNPIWAP